MRRSVCLLLLHLSINCIFILDFFNVNYLVPAKFLIYLHVVWTLYVTVFYGIRQLSIENFVASTLHTPSTLHVPSTSVNELANSSLYPTKSIPHSNKYLLMKRR